MSQKTPDLIARHLPVCPACHQAPGKYQMGTWKIHCVNEDCPEDAMAEHIVSFYAERIWRYYADPALHFGKKMAVDADSFAV